MLAGWVPDAAYFQLRIDERCRRTSDGCLDWIGARNTSNSPVMRFEAGFPQTVRTWLWAQYRGRVPNPKRDRIIMTCGNDDCVEPSHMIMRPANGKLRGRKRTFATILRASLSASRKITRDDARAIRASDESSKVLAERYNVTRETINQIRRGQTHRDPMAGIFSQLIAA